VSKLLHGIIVCWPSQEVWGCLFVCLFVCSGRIKSRHWRCVWNIRGMPAANPQGRKIVVMVTVNP